ncbi:hypothetical protein P4O66_001999 [Electrophorus voltai]|uniref:Reverse transcriptase domain-containing protein n=1 Tax=Electrophorus voltai TaxID=2609070 RepID=A0AAD8ZVM9_9TELE|nr:hypothetical protein P4O66_001999 [Electrophorus voltai]
MKCFENLVRDFITSSLPASMDPLQFAYRHNCSTDDAIAHLLHTTLTHLDEGRGNYVKMLFVDYSSAFNTIIPSLLTTKLEDLGLHTSLCNWISNFLTDRPQSVRVGNCASSTLTLSTGAPQGCVLSPLLYSLYTYDCTATSSSTIIVKFADDTVVMGLISDNDERAYLEEIKHLENWCQENNLLLNVSKTKELIVDCSKKQERHYQPVRISGTTVERVDSVRYLGVHISQDLSWSRHTNSLAKKARQHLYHLRCLRDFRLPSKVLRNFYTCTIESILTENITVWFGNSTKQDRQALQRVVRSAERITDTELPDLQTIYYKRCQTKARRIVKDPTHPNNILFSLLRNSNCRRRPEMKSKKRKDKKGHKHSLSPRRETLHSLGHTSYSHNRGECHWRILWGSYRPTSDYRDWENSDVSVQLDAEFDCVEDPSREVEEVLHKDSPSVMNTASAESKSNVPPSPKAPSRVSRSRPGPGGGPGPDSAESYLPLLVYRDQFTTTTSIQGRTLQGPTFSPWTTGMAMRITAKNDQHTKDAMRDQDSWYVVVPQG